jgi:tRNA nucleotidyltransferase (CCA-adding enzyme)
MEKVNLSPQIGTSLSEISDFLRGAGRLALGEGKRIFLVGGVVRDILLGRKSTDIDLVIEGDALEFALHLPLTKISSHPRFGTVKLRLGDISIDIASARSETYPHPGSLPQVRWGTMEEDLSRRDFTINAIAASLSPAVFGDLLDPYQGREDLEEGIIRVLHERSFQDDATRILRALRYKERFDFKFALPTLSLILQDGKMLHTISGDRLRHEVESWLREEEPERIFHEAHRLGVLREIYSELKWDKGMDLKFKKARKFQNPSLYLGLLAYQLSLPQGEEFIHLLKFPQGQAKAIRGVITLKEDKNLEGLTSPYAIWEMLQDYSWEALYAFCLSEKGQAAQNVKLYLAELQAKPPFLSGRELKQRGVPPGPYMGKVLQRIRKARFSGELKTREEEEKMVEDFLHSFPPP